jgi:hypothetical protein
MKKVLFLFAVLMASVNLASTEQATGIIKCSDGNAIPFVAISVKGTNAGTITSSSRTFQLLALSGIPPKSDRC